MIEFVAGIIVGVILRHLGPRLVSQFYGHGA